LKVDRKIESKIFVSLCKKLHHKKIQKSFQYSTTIPETFWGQGPQSTILWKVASARKPLFEETPHYMEGY